MDRFPEIVPTHEYDSVEDRPSHDIFSVIFHLSHAASLYNVPACLSLARARVGLNSSVSPLLKTNVPIDFESSKELCIRAMNARAPAAAKVAAGCLLFQILEDEENAGDGASGDTEKIRVLEHTLSQVAVSREEIEIMKEHSTKQARGRAAGLHAGDKVEANYMMEGNHYAAVVVEVNDDKTVTVQYDDDGSTETLAADHVKSVDPPSVLTAAPLSDTEALGSVNFDEDCLYEEYELMSKLGSLLEKAGRLSEAVELYQGAAEKAMSCGKMKTAHELNMRLAQLEG
jgi:uncharacterized protein with GYD domain